MLRSTFIIVVYVLFIVTTTYAQGFNTFNGRNHPELDWQVAETEHFRIMYPAHLAGIEIEAATIAEASYKTLSKNLDVTFDKPLKIFLSDEDEILNGFAVPLGYTNIWVHVNDVSRQWAGRVKWLRTVLSHELAHLFHYEAIKGKPRFLSFFLGDPLPSFWAEGLAQYETEEWDVNRGDRWLRTAILDDRLSYNDRNSRWNGALRYAVGNSQLRYLTSQYGDSTLTKILKHRKKIFGGRLQSHDFYTAFEETTDKSYFEFYDEWRRHVNIYYNTLAGQMETADSLNAKPVKFPGQYVLDLAFHSDSTHFVTLTQQSNERPVVRLQVVDATTGNGYTIAEGAIQTFTLSADGQHVAFSRRTRSKNGSLLNDLFLLENIAPDGKRSKRKEKQLTFGRRAISPSFSPDGSKLTFIGSAGGTANVFLLDLETRIETQLTFFEGDVQLSSLTWHSRNNQIAISRFNKNGDRDLLLLNPASRVLRPLHTPGGDAQWPVWSPDGEHIAFTSRKDDVPNVFIHDLEANTTHRVTHVVTGATVHDWLPADSLHATGTLIVSSSTSRRREKTLRVDAGRRIPEVKIDIPPAYTYWTQHRPPVEVAAQHTPDPNLVLNRERYSSGKNMLHLASFAIPYYNNGDDWGVAGFTSWTEPLAKHTVAFTASASIPTFLENSFLFASYINNQLRPTLGFNLYSLIPTATAYGERYLIDALTGGDFSIDWPLDIAPKPYTATRFGARLLYASVDPLNETDFDPLPATLLPIEKGERAEIRVGFTRKKQRPFRYNGIHPLDGLGIRLQIESGANILGGDTRFFQAGVAAYAVIPTVLYDRLFVYGKAQWLSGSRFNQDRPGFARFDDVQITAPQFGILAFSDTERVRGFRQFAYGNTLLFGTAEYRMLLLRDLETRILGLISLGATSGAGFIDAGGVWDENGTVARRVGIGVELKNALTIGGILEITHAVGIAQPVPDFGSTDIYDLYYRIRAALPF